MLIVAKIGFTAQTFNEWAKKTVVDSGRKLGVTADIAWRLKALEREIRELRQLTRYCARRRLILPRRSSTARSGDDRLH